VSTLPSSASEPAAQLAICRAASRPYLQADRFAYYFARGKLAADPLFTDLLLSGALSGCQHVLDLGCGQGLLRAWLHAAQTQCFEGDWPTGWPEPPRPLHFRGVDVRRNCIRRAQVAWGHLAQFDVQDLREADCRGADAVLVLDVVHYIDYVDQQALLSRVRSALRPGGVLILRVADAAGGIAFRLSGWVDQMNDLVRDGRRSPFFCRSLPQWLALLQSCGFTARTCDGKGGRSFANRLLIAHAA
jgi:SAM-dependent methyltransferase